MSIPGEQPNNPYAQPSPTPGPNPNPVPAPNPYNQPTMGYGAAVPPTPPPPPPAPPRGGLPGWLWGVSGAVLASAVWAAAMIATGGFGEREPEADLAGYHFHDDMCEVFDRSALRGHYSEDSSREPTQYSADQDVLSSSYCSIRMKAPGARSYDTTYVSFEASWHKKTDPRAEFEARVRQYEERESETANYEVEAIEGLGEEAFLVTDRDKDDDKLRWARLSVRDGWVEAAIDWNDISSSSSNTRPLSKARVQEMLESDTKATLAALKKQPGTSGDDGRTGGTGGADDDDGTENSDPPRRGEGDI